MSGDGVGAARFVEAQRARPKAVLSSPVFQYRAAAPVAVLLDPDPSAIARILSSAPT
jgi:hypothetical protein